MDADRFWASFKANDPWLAPLLAWRPRLGSHADAKEPRKKRGRERCDGILHTKL